MRPIASPVKYFYTGLPSYASFLLLCFPTGMAEAITIVCRLCVFRIFQLFLKSLNFLSQIFIFLIGSPPGFSFQLNFLTRLLDTCSKLSHSLNAFSRLGASVSSTYFLSSSRVMPKVLEKLDFLFCPVLQFLITGIATRSA